MKGKLQAERIFALLGDADLRATPAFADMAAANARMLAAYRARDWDGAEAALAELDAADGRLSGYVALYRRRIAEARAVPPPPDWDGVYDATGEVISRRAAPRTASGGPAGSGSSARCGARSGYRPSPSSPA